jgi:hypothetical protein
MLSVTQDLRFILSTCMVVSSIIRICKIYAYYSTNTLDLETLKGGVRIARPAVMRADFSACSSFLQIDIM